MAATSHRIDSRLSTFLLMGCLLAPGLAAAAPSAQQQQQNRLQEQRQQDQQRRFQNMQLPQAEQPGNQRLPDVQPQGSCFVVRRLVIDTLDGKPQPFGHALARWLKQRQGRCYSLAGIKRLQAELFNWLTDKGYVTSRVLLPEQDISRGELHLLLVPGRLEAMQADGLPPRLLRMALPARPGDLVNLRDMEQAMENLSRLPNMDAHLSLAPGTGQGGSTLVGKASWPRHTSAGLLLNSNYYGHHNHADAQVNVGIGSLFGLLDNLSFSINSNLNKQDTDMAVGGSLGYDLAMGNWLLSLGYTQQIYENQVHGILEDFQTSGDTRNGRLSLARMLYRSQSTRLSLALHGNYSDVGNYLDEATIRVSSYWLRKVGASLDIKRQWPGAEWQVSLSGEQGYASGEAVWAGVAPQDFRIWHVYFEGSRPLESLPLIMSFQMNGQFAPDWLLSSERYSLTASSVVPGFDNDYASADSAASAEWKLSGRPTGVPFAPTAFFALNTGVARGDDALPFVRLVSSSVGTSMNHGQANVSLKLSVPIAQMSSIDPTSHYTLSGSFYWQY